MKNFFKKYKMQIVAILGAVVAIAAAFETVGGNAGIFCTVVAVVGAIVIYFIKNGVNDVLTGMIVAAIKTIYELIQEEKVTSANKLSAEMNESRIKEMYIKNLEDK